MADLILSGVVGDDITADSVKSFLDSNDDQDITVYINSPGGYVFDGLEVYNLLRASGRNITTVLTGLAASMGSIIFLAGDTRQAMTGSIYMVHKPSGLAYGDSDDLRQEADVLDKIQDSLQNIYKERAGIDNIEDFVNAETWWNIDEMNQYGIINSNENTQLEENMATIEELKAEKEKLKAELAEVSAQKAELEEQAEKAKLEAELATMKADIAKIKSQNEAENDDEEDSEPEEEIIVVVEDDDEAVKSDDENSDEDSDENDDEESDDEPAEQAVINTKKVKAVSKSQKVPAFMQTDSKY